MVTLKFRIKHLVLSVLSLCASLSFSTASNLKENTFIRDSEIENFLKEIAAPIFQVASQDPSRLQLHLFYSSEVNAAATFDNTMIVNTGLILKSENAGQIASVIAHETGHMASGHIVQRAGAMQESMKGILASLALGAASVLAGAPGLGTAIMAGGMDAAQNGLLHYSRGQEAAADQAAVRYMKALNWPIRDLYAFMKILASMELLSTDRQFEYMRTHPFSTTRMSLVEDSAKKQSPSAKMPKKIEDQFARIKLKIAAFSNQPRATLMQFPDRDQSDLAVYARAIAYYRMREFPKALSNINVMIKRHPKDPYAWELQGQIFFDEGSIQQSTNSFKTALSLAPNDPLLHLSYVEALLQLGRPQDLREALEHLFKARKIERENPRVMQYLAVVYGKMGHVDQVALALAEKFFLVGDYKGAYQQAERALALTHDKHVKLTATDIRDVSKRELEQGRNLS